jgi:hypothetical protein
MKELPTRNVLRTAMVISGAATTRDCFPPGTARRAGYPGVAMTLSLRRRSNLELSLAGNVICSDLAIWEPLTPKSIVSFEDGADLSSSPEEGRQIRGIR